MDNELVEYNNTSKWGTPQATSFSTISSERIVESDLDQRQTLITAEIEPRMRRFITACAGQEDKLGKMLHKIVEEGVSEFKSSRPVDINNDPGWALQNAAWQFYHKLMELYPKSYNVENAANRDNSIGMYSAGAAEFLTHGLVFYINEDTTINLSTDYGTRGQQMHWIAQNAAETFLTAVSVLKNEAELRTFLEAFQGEKHHVTDEFLDHFANALREMGLFAYN